MFFKNYPIPVALLTAEWFSLVFLIDDISKFCKFGYIYEWFCLEKDWRRYGSYIQTCLKQLHGKKEEMVHHAHCS